jgi:hypothetical protein
MQSNLAPILWAGLIAGVLDITDAFVFFGLSAGVKPIQILHTIASGLLGSAAFKGGWRTGALGLLLHFVIAYSWTAIYYAASRKLAFLNAHFVACGLTYGLGVFLFMNLVVLPLSAVSRPSMSAIGLINGVLAIMLLVGLPIAVITARYAR